MKKLLIVGAVLAAAGAAYYVMKPGAPGSGALSLSAVSTVGPLDYVPADTAFVFANVEPMPKAVTKAWMEQFAQVSGIYAMQAKMVEQELAKEDPEGKGVKWARALAAETRDRTPEQIMAELGIDMQMRYAMYEVAARPVVRLELADSAKTRAFIARIEQNAGDKVPTAKVDALDYWNFADAEGKGRLVAAIDGSQLVLAFLSSTQDDAALRTAFGLDRPKQSLAASGKLVALNKEFGYTPYSSGYVDTRKLIALVDDAQPAADAPAAADMKATCEKDYDAIAKAMPRFVFGYTQFEAKSMQAKMLLELRPDIAADLQPVPAPLPGAHATAGSALNFGFAMNLEALANFANKQADAIIAAPYACPALADLNDGATKAKEQFSNPGLYMAASAFNAVHVIASKFAMPQPGVEGASSSEPEFAGKLLIGSKSPAGLIGMLGGFAPQVAALNLQPNGELKALPADPSIPVKGPMHALMTDAAIGVSIGDGESTTLKDTLAADADNKTLLSIGYGGAFFQTIFAQASADLATSEDPEAMELQKTMAALQKVYADSIDRIDMQMRVADRGVEFVQDVRLK
ncbi:MAG: hypothetical protein IPO95_02850 [Rhodanobacteraceae bacterium]|nr:hypothetical protein [Rhodanobacteraceae bacterium]MBL0041348.1 hypothetical protein [Xanthomonadales bacterium]MBP6077440.1 hypothetical protein [Xanthomonadales bacterium]MBP7623229.1 hypothetical protein [Xanthomonadales bacterium]